MLAVMLSSAAMLAVPEPLPIVLEYPESQLRRERSAAALIEVLVDSEGMPLQCETLQEFGDESFSREICGLQGAFRYRPAMDIEGMPTAGIARLLVKYVTVGARQSEAVRNLDAPGMTVEAIAQRLRSGSRTPATEEIARFSAEPQIVVHPDITLDVVELPQGAGDYLDESVVVAVDGAGTITACTPAEAIDGVARQLAFANAACDHVLGATIFSPVSVDGAAVSTVRMLHVRFAAAKDE